MSKKTQNQKSPAIELQQFKAPTTVANVAATAQKTAKEEKCAAEAPELEILFHEQTSVCIALPAVQTKEAGKAWSKADEDLLSQCEGQITKHFEGFIETAQALKTIKDNRLYRQEYKTFEEYCRQRWGFGRQHAYRLIAAEQTVADLSSIGDTPLPANESQARALAKLPNAEAKADAMRRASKKSNDKPTTTQIEESVAEVAAEAESDSDETASTSSREGVAVKSAIFKVLPPHLHQGCTWNACRGQRNAGGRRLQ